MTIDITAINSGVVFIILGVGIYIYMNLFLWISECTIYVFASINIRIIIYIGCYQINLTTYLPQSHYIELLLAPYLNSHIKHRTIGIKSTQVLTDLEKRTKVAAQPLRFSACEHFLDFPK